MVRDDPTAAAIELRRDLHRHPEPAWREFYTTSRIVEALDALGSGSVEIHLGREALDPDRRRLSPGDEELDRWREVALEAGASHPPATRGSSDVTGCVAVLERGPGPVVGLRVDIDGLTVTESRDDAHRPAAEGFRSTREGFMQACAHDAHAAIGVGVLDRLVDEAFEGTVKVYFQPAEEVADGAHALVGGGHLDDLDALLAIHLGLGHPTGTIVPGFDGFLAVSQFEATFEGRSAHAGVAPQDGADAVRAMADAVAGLHGIPRHGGGSTRINVGRVSGGSAVNVVPDRATLEGEVRGGTTELMRYMREQAHRVLDSSASRFGCSVSIEDRAEAPSASSDPRLADVVATVAERTDGVDTVRPIVDFSASEDATVLLRHVQSTGGLASYVGIGTDHPGGHHSPTFDVDERSIGIGIDLLTTTILEVLRNPSRLAE